MLGQSPRKKTGQTGRVKREGLILAVNSLAGAESRDVRAVCKREREGRADQEGGVCVSRRPGKKNL